jgi:alanyl-tRNA synthetase
LKEAKGASKLKESNVASEAGILLEKAEKIGQTSIVVGRLSGASDEQVRSAIDMIKKKAQSAAIFFGYADNDKVTLAAGVSDDLIKRGLSAGDLVKQLAPIIDGRGGGRPHMAQAGGKNPEKLDEALAKASEIIRGKLANA